MNSSVNLNQYRHIHCHQIPHVYFWLRHVIPIKVKLYDQGLTTIQVTDNGAGVPKSDRCFIATKHATSKLRTFGDLYGQTDAEGDGPNDNKCDSMEVVVDNENNAKCKPISTLGFRGEALFSLANISKSFVVSTRTKEERTGEELSFDSQGNVIKDSSRPVARGVGTTVSVHGLFERLPVRRVDLCKRIKSQRMKLIKILQGCKSSSICHKAKMFIWKPFKPDPTA